MAPCGGVVRFAWGRMGEFRHLRGRAVMVTGAAGFLGCAVRAALIGAGARVIAVDRNPPCDDLHHGWIRQSCGEHDIAFDKGRPDTLIHLAWDNLPSRGDRDLAGDVQRNVHASVRLFEQVAAAGVRSIIYPSSGGTIYGAASIPTPEDAPIQPLGGYAAGKASIELFLRAMHHARGIDACILRLANPYGPGQRPERGQGFIATAANRVLRREPVEVFGDGRAVRDFVYVDDVARAFILAAAKARGFATYNIGGGSPIAVAEALDLVFYAAERRSAVRFLPPRPSDLAHSGLAISRAAADLDWRPTTPLEAGVRATVAWHRRLLPSAVQRQRLSAWAGRRQNVVQPRPSAAV